MHAVVNKYTNFVENSLVCRKPVQLMQDRGDVHNSSCQGVWTCHQSGSMVLEPLYFFKLMLGGSSKERVVVT